MDLWTKFINLYISIMAIIALLITIGIFNISNEPKVEILRPIYIFDMHRINKTLTNFKSYNIYPYLSELNNKFCTCGGFDSSYYQSSLKYVLPYFKIDAKLYERSSSLDSRSFLYHLGITDEVDITQSYFNTSSNRSENHKIIGLSTLCMNDFITKFTKDSLSYFGDILKNPLIELYKKSKMIKNIDFEIISREFTFATTIYSIISICNNSSENMDKVNIFINDVLNTGMLEIIGWSAGYHRVELKSNGPNFQLDIFMLKPKQSIEILFRGNKKIRENDIKTSTNTLSSINKNKVFLIISFLFIIIIIFYILDNKRQKIFNKDK